MFKKFIFLFLTFLTLISNIYGDSNNYIFEIMGDSELCTNVYVNDSGYKGNTLLIIGGIHGDEEAGIKAAEILTSYTPKRGTIVVIPKANIAACNNNSRTVYYLNDLNRSFIGLESGNDTQRLAWEITNVITNFTPVMIADLHESNGKYDESSNYIGQSIVLNSNPNHDCVEIAIEVLDKTDFTVISGSPMGSINKEISDKYDIPVITIETYTNQEMEKRIAQHLAIIGCILDYYGMED